MVEFVSYAQLVIGPAGSGKSTYCKILQAHAKCSKRTIRVINLDPAAENFEYECDIDIRELISVDDVMSKKKLGPNGALVFCMEYILSKFDWIEEQINSLGDNSYFLIDCPGQLELYSNYPVMKDITKRIKSLGINIMSVFCFDCTFTSEYSKFISGSTLALACMLQLELPHLNILTKADLIKNEEALEQLRELDIKSLLLKEESFEGIKTKFYKLNKALVELLDNYSLVALTPLNILDEDSVNEILYNCDITLQYFDNQEPREEFYENKNEEFADEENDDQEIDSEK